MFDISGIGLVNYAVSGLFYIGFPVCVLWLLGRAFVVFSDLYEETRSPILPRMVKPFVRHHD